MAYLLVLVGGAVVPVVLLLCDDVVSGLGSELFRCDAFSVDLEDTSPSPSASAAGPDRSKRRCNGSANDACSSQHADE